MRPGEGLLAMGMCQPEGGSVQTVGDVPGKSFGFDVRVQKGFLDVTLEQNS